MIAALRWRDHGSVWSLALGAFSYLLALMSKEVAYATLLLVPASFLLMPDPGTPVPHLKVRVRNAPPKVHSPGLLRASLT